MTTQKKKVQAPTVCSLGLQGVEFLLWSCAQSYRKGDTLDIQEIGAMHKECPANFTMANVEGVQCSLWDAGILVNKQVQGESSIKIYSVQY